MVPEAQNSNNMTSKSDGRKLEDSRAQDKHVRLGHLQAEPGPYIGIDVECVIVFKQ